MTKVALENEVVAQS